MCQSTVMAVRSRVGARSGPFLQRHSWQSAAILDPPGAPAVEGIFIRRVGMQEKTQARGIHEPGWSS
jgi:hypothetical protein